MSDHIDYDGKRYFEESHLQSANRNAERRGEELTAALQRIAELERDREILHGSMTRAVEVGEQRQRHLDAIAQALYPDKPKDDCWTYQPDQLVGMVTELRKWKEIHSAILSKIATAIDPVEPIDAKDILPCIISDREVRQERDALQRELAALRGALEQIMDLDCSFEKWPVLKAQNIAEAALTARTASGERDK